MRLTVAGCGTAVPDPERVASGYTVACPGALILLDCGPGVVHGMARAGVDWAGLTHIAITHFHNDHIGDLPALFFALRYGTRPRRSAPLTLLGPPGLSALVRALPDALGAHMRDPGFPLEIREVSDGESIACGQAMLLVRRTLHTDQSVAYRIEAEGRSVGYTGDTPPDPGLAGFMENVDALLCECSLPAEEALPSHLTPASVAALAGVARPGLLLLTHIYPQLDRTTLPERIADLGWAGATRVVHDGDVIDV